MHGVVATATEAYVVTRAARRRGTAPSVMRPRARSRGYAHVAAPGPPHVDEFVEPRGLEYLPDPIGDVEDRGGSLAQPPYGHHEHPQSLGGDVAQAPCVYAQFAHPVAVGLKGLQVRRRGDGVDAAVHLAVQDGVALRAPDAKVLIADAMACLRAA